MSSEGWARFAAINSWPYVYIRVPASSGVTLPTDAFREPPKSKLRLDGLEQPMPFGLRNSQQDADHLHRNLCGHVDEKVERLAEHHTASSKRRARERRSSSTRLIIRGVRPRADEAADV